MPSILDTKRSRTLMRAGGDGGGTSTTTTSTCPCLCIANGDLLVHGIETVSRWSVVVTTRIPVR